MGHHTDAGHESHQKALRIDGSRIVSFNAPGETEFMRMFAV
tara:strand:- start:3442 stop:3564 length:123 start_codon:yes stop_codon:yes gene_type:complete